MLNHVLNNILSQLQLKNADAYTIQTQPIPSIELMENASKAFVNSLNLKELDNSRLGVFCGCGNNGGDGLAIARILIDKGYYPTVYLVKHSPELSPDCEINFRRLDKVTIINEESDIPKVNQFDIVIDALFGSGLSREITGITSNVIHAINEVENKVISVDIPSGMYCDTIVDGVTIEASKTISFQRPKLSFFFEEHFQYLGKLKVIDIGLDESFIQSQTSNHYVLDEKIGTEIKLRDKAAHKGTFGHALLFVGSYGKMGAAVLSARSCLRSGAGLLTTHIPKAGYEVMQAGIPEAMCSIDENDKVISTFPDISLFPAIGIGPGIGTSSETQDFLSRLLAQTATPLVLDADALNILSMNPDMQKSIPSNSILTPHPKEFERMAGNWSDSLERMHLQQALAKRLNCIVILKGAHTQIATPSGEVFFNTSGNPGMATGGSGDVLTGIITGLLAQGYTPLQSALIGVYHHGKAGDLASELKGQSSVIASDLIESLRIE